MAGDSIPFYIVNIFIDVKRSSLQALVVASVRLSFLWSRLCFRRLFYQLVRLTFGAVFGVTFEETKNLEVPGL